MNIKKWNEEEEVTTDGIDIKELRKKVILKIKNLSEKDKHVLVKYINDNIIVIILLMHDISDISSVIGKLAKFYTDEINEMSYFDTDDSLKVIIQLELKDALVENDETSDKNKSSNSNVLKKARSL
uniref:FtsZ_C domain-containing protein n=1 Tax=Parastrongyloides trichosuri TaxID=131310 RepID=A0A0N4Z6L6_PARTI